VLLYPLARQASVQHAAGHTNAAQCTNPAASYKSSQNPHSIGPAVLQCAHQLLESRVQYILQDVVGAKTFPLHNMGDVAASIASSSNIKSKNKSNSNSNINSDSDSNSNATGDSGQRATIRAGAAPQ
jgi:hypothetical protein